ncbi:MAG: M24 family metallopeptidase [Dissulfurispiraceae bacterium]
MVPQTEIQQRLQNLQGRLGEAGIDGALFVFPVDVYYFSGSRQNAALWVPAERAPTLLVKKSYLRAVKESGVEDVRHFTSSKELAAFFGKDVRKIGLTLDVLPVQHYWLYAGLGRGWEIVDISSLNRELRSVKSPWELDRMRISGRKVCDVFAQIPGVLRPGMREIDLAAEFEYRLRKSGSEGRVRIRAFNQEIIGLVAAGENAAIPGCFDGAITGKGLSSAAPYGPSRDPIRDGVPIVIDYAGIFEGYIVDMTRVFAFGDIDAELKRAFDVSLRIQAWLTENLRPGRICAELFEGATRIAEAEGLGDKFMGYPGEQAKFVGHGVGLELDEFPVLAKKVNSPLLSGQTLAIEPKFVFPGKGAIGIENTCAVKQELFEMITDLSDDIVYL